MATETGWPFGGPWVTAKDASQFIAHQIYSLKGGERLNDPIIYNQAPVLRQVKNKVYQNLHNISKDLAIKDLKDPISENDNLQALCRRPGSLRKALTISEFNGLFRKGRSIGPDPKKLMPMTIWTGQPLLGNWELYALFQGWHGKMVERAAPGGEGLVIDHFSKQAIENYLTRFDSAFSDRSTNTLRAFFNDSYEVDDARGQANWTPQLLQAFLEKRGYDLQEHIPALLGKDTPGKKCQSTI